MKRVLSIVVVLLSLRAAAQPAYPAQQPVPNLKTLEYFVDKDPGFGNGHPIPLSASTNLSSLQFQADLTGVAPGFHRLYVRTLDTDNKWSLHNWTFFDNYVLPPYPAASSTFNITAVEYYFDNDPGYGNATPLPLPPSNDQVTKPLVVNVSGLSPGVHKIFIRAKDENGKWSLVNFGQFDNTAAVPYPSAPAQAPPIGEMEYYIDTDPGFGNGNKITFTAGTDITNFSVDIPLSGVSQGPHTFHIRSRQNPWSLTAFVPFIYSSTLPVTWLYVKGEMKTDKAYIDWATANEEDADKFIVEHSTDGRQFVTAGEVKAAGNSSTTKKYQFIHSSPARGMNYYRIKQIDKNGTFTYSKALHLLYHPDRKELLVAPNPATDQVYVISGSGRNVTRAEMFDMSGKQVFTKQLNAGQQVYSLDISSVQKGIYLLKLYDDTGVTTQRIMKQ
ncbi:T9SS type A sorting domain-containing protein [Terrimonas sp. NA20]|uniref:T9SS type A sorting domain-containing protein n=1 Tax=Terrimonas ginsenosidimutans TaxID=2908004 RepID=A0ABS9KU80_9BACT|nr:T9SS type A sorting domain-containing protein [Terrimonas ginsenosidimutans]MCG2615855.1 T9SS type A sorting domain-containing protein [Terrimonas ginsenosidimutans]